MRQLKSLKIFLALSVLFNIAGIAVLFYAIHNRGGVDYLVVKYNEMRGVKTEACCSEYRVKHDLFKQLPDLSTDVYFVGDSLTAFGEWHELLDLKQARNRGINGDHSAGILARISEVTKGKPSKIFLMIGINDLQQKVPVTTVLENYARILSQIARQSPRSQVYVQSVLPVNTLKYQKFIKPHFVALQMPLRNTIEELNKSLSRLTNQYENSTYIDFPSLLNESNELKSELTYDGLHLNAVGMTIWAKALDKYLHLE